MNNELSVIPPPRGEGKQIVSGANDVQGGALFRSVYAPPDWPSASHPPHKGGGIKAIGQKRLTDKSLISLSSPGCKNIRLFGLPKSKL
jgi:hypothetical protein